MRERYLDKKNPDLGGVVEGGGDKLSFTQQKVCRRCVYRRIDVATSLCPSIPIALVSNNSHLSIVRHTSNLDTKAER
jgi:hypothetical protein